MFNIYKDFSESFYGTVKLFYNFFQIPVLIVPQSFPVCLSISLFCKNINLYLYSIKIKDVIHMLKYKSQNLKNRFMNKSIQGIIRKMFPY